MNYACFVRKTVFACFTKADGAHSSVKYCRHRLCYLNDKTINYPFLTQNYLKGEWKSDIHLISVNGEDLEEFEQIWIIRFWVMDLWSFSKSLLWISLSWQLRQNLWCHWAQLSIGYVQRVSQNFICINYYKDKLYWFFQKWCRIDVAM